MLFSAVVVIGCLVSSVLGLVDFEDNVIPSDDSLQDLLTRTKKSPDIILGPKKSWNKDNKKTIVWNSSRPEEESRNQQQSETTDSEVSAEITAVLVKDIKKKLKDLEELENSYKMLKSDSPNIERVDDKIKPEINESINSKIRSFLESKLSDDKILDEEESVRIARQYNQDTQNYQAFYGKGIMSAENAYSDNGRYRGLSGSSTNMYGDRGDPYLARYNPSARTYGAAGIQGYEYGGKEKKEHESPLKPLKQLKQIIPNVINALAEITAPVKPVQNTVKPEYHAPPVKKPEYSAHKPTSGLHLQEQHGHKHKGLAPIFFSKQLIFGIGADKKVDTKNYGNTFTEGYSYPAYSYYPYGYSYSSPAPYWGPLRDDYANLYPESNPYYPTFYSLSPDAQNVYDPTFSPYPQGNAHIETPNPQVKIYPADSNYKSVYNPYRPHEAAPVYRSDEFINQEDSRSETLDNSPHKPQNLTLDEIATEIKKEKERINKIRKNLDSTENTSSSEEKDTQLSNNVKVNPSIHRRSAANEKSVGSGKVSKLCYKGKIDDKTDAFNFMEMEC